MNSEPRIENIFPLTIIRMRFGGKIVIFNAECDNDFVEKIQKNKEVASKLTEYIEDHVWTPYGIGKTLDEAFADFRRRTGDSFDYM